MVLGEVVIWIGGALLLGFVGFFVVLIGGMLRILQRIVSAPFRWRWGRAARCGVPVLQPPRACAHPRCGYLNRPRARYCAQCGTPLE